MVAISGVGDKRQFIIEYLTDHISCRASEISALLGITASGAKVLLRELLADDIIVADGGNRNRTYRLKS